MSIIHRKSLEEFLKSKGRRLLYGRRKTGKTFYARLVLGDYDYFIVRRGGLFYNPVEDLELDVRSFTRLCRRLDKVIVDEFHRAPPIFFDIVQTGECSGELVFITSTLHYHKRLIEGVDAPLKGLFTSYRVGLISPIDLLRHRWTVEPSKEWFEILVFYQEPVLLDRKIMDIVIGGKDIAQSLVGEVLSEEDQVAVERFNAILEAVAAGRTRLTEIAGYLHSRGLLPKQTTSLITKYMDIMVKIGLLERIPVWGKKRRHVYRHVSPLTSIQYYLHTRYEHFDIQLPWGFLEKAVSQYLPLLVEQFVERLLAEAWGLKPVKILEPDEIDIGLVEYKKLRIVGEVKWKSKISRSEIKRIESKLYSYPEAEKILIVPDETIVPETELKILDIRKMTELARKQNLASKLK